MGSLFGLDTAELEAFAAEAGEPPYRGRQLAGWLYKKNAVDVAAMTDLPRRFRERIAAAAPTCGNLRLLSKAVADDGTRKFLFGSDRGGTLEAVLMPVWADSIVPGGDRDPEASTRVTACISTQVGCAVGCVFCATGLSGFQKNVTAGEMVEQVVRMQRETGMRVSNVVFMGMGEPFLNYDETLKAVRLLNSEVGIGMRHLTISTSGIIPGIDRLAGEKLQLTLAVSLHAPTDELRDFLVPLNKKYPLADLKAAMKRYLDKTGRRLTVEYVMLHRVNDSAPTAAQLADYLRDLPGIHVNLIPYNATDAEFRPSPPRAIARFQQILRDRGINATVRVERGAEIDGACGQLRRRLDTGAPLVKQEPASLAEEDG
ncbi:MAG: 23S rRNA (adenine(2503)-C(2))-methyltransferase RlmN [Candidatus Sericytochromatia bacterium]|uniref:Probable dual-specificity RNA methyltransferase RlmN n=1 Tax=Candidatus Tanganyikabacteria bacterium TaxID=2961651 RepID=A0A937X0I4_9BACT|nr:23S rRNA (adenine(2503)-C(2))-methyltransferase RlmN [Candidatus Tanganyikabacteria bacterium]